MRRRAASVTALGAPPLARVRLVLASLLRPIGACCRAGPDGVAAAQKVPRITRIEFSPAPEEDGGGVNISLLGSGECASTMDYGDGKSERRTATLPDRMRHGYAADGQYRVVATPDAPM